MQVLSKFSTSQNSNHICLLQKQQQLFSALQTDDWCRDQERPN